MMRWSTTLMMSSGDSRPQWARTNGHVGAVQAVATFLGANSQQLLFYESRPERNNRQGFGSPASASASRTSAAKPYAPKANGKGEGVIQTSPREWPVPALAALRAAELTRRHHRHNWGSWQYRLGATCQQTPPSRD